MSVCGGKVNPFKKGKTQMVLLTAAGIRPLKVSVADIDIDGMDATETVVRCILESRWRIEVLLAKSIPIAGFNLIDPEEVLKRTGLPSVFVLGREPDSAAVEEALRRHFADWERRLSVIRKPTGLRIFETQGCGKVLLEFYGISSEEAFRIVSDLTIFGKIPEPLRVCCMLAKAIS
ncbi:MAG: DUF99 family protein [Candidatus Methanosuratus sp.]|nr:DUF99 family protein [Candidatus Methanosuratincola sp.]